MIIASYKVDKALYHAPATVHHRVMITTEHTYKNTKLVHLHLGKNLCIRLNNVLQYEYHKSIESEQYFYGKTYSKSKAKPKPTTRSTYE